MDSARAERVAAAVKMMLAEGAGQPYEVRKRIGVLVGVLRGHKLTPEGMTETDDGTVVRCEVCERSVKIPTPGGIEGKAAETDCSAAEWTRY